MLIVMVFLYAMPLLNRQTKGMLSNYISHHPLLPCISQNKFLAASSAHFASGKVLYLYTGCLIACLSCSFFAKMSLLEEVSIYCTFVLVEFQKINDI